MHGGIGIREREILNKVAVSRAPLTPAATSENLTGVKALDSCECAADLTAECPLMSLHWVTGNWELGTKNWELRAGKWELRSMNWRLSIVSPRSMQMSVSAQCCHSTNKYKTSRRSDKSWGLALILSVGTTTAVGFTLTMTFPSLNLELKLSPLTRPSSRHGMAIGRSHKLTI